MELLLPRMIPSDLNVYDPMQFGYGEKLQDPRSDTVRGIPWYVSYITTGKQIAVLYEQIMMTQSL